MKFNEELLSAYLDDELSPEQRKQVEVELESSPILKRRMAELRSVRALVQKLPRASLERSSMDEIWKRVERIKREGNGVSANPLLESSPAISLAPKKDTSGRWSARQWGALAAVAAGLAFVVTPLTMYSLSTPSSFVAFDSVAKQRASEMPAPMTSSAPMVANSPPRDEVQAPEASLNAESGSTGQATLFGAASDSLATETERFGDGVPPAPRKEVRSEELNSAELAKAVDSPTNAPSGDASSSFPPGVAGGSQWGGRMADSFRSSGSIVGGELLGRIPASERFTSEPGQSIARPAWYWVDSQLLADDSLGSNTQGIQVVGDDAAKQESIHDAGGSAGFGVAKNESESGSRGAQSQSGEVAEKASALEAVVEERVMKDAAGASPTIVESNVSQERLLQLSASATPVEYKLNVESLAQVVALAERTDSPLLAMNVASTSLNSGAAGSFYGMPANSADASNSGGSEFGRRDLDRQLGPAFGAGAAAGLGGGGGGAGGLGGAMQGGPGGGTQPAADSLPAVAGGMPGVLPRNAPASALAKGQTESGEVGSVDSSRPSPDSEAGIRMLEEQTARSYAGEDRAIDLKRKEDADDPKRGVALPRAASSGLGEANGEAENLQAKDGSQGDKAPADVRLQESNANDALRGMRGSSRAQGGASSVLPPAPAGAGSKKSSAEMPSASRSAAATEIPRSKEDTGEPVDQEFSLKQQPAPSEASKSAPSDPSQMSQAKKPSGMGAMTGNSIEQADRGQSAQMVPQENPYRLGFAPADANLAFRYRNPSNQLSEQSEENNRIVLLMRRSRWNRISQMLGQQEVSEGGKSDSSPGEFSSGTEGDVELGAGVDAESLDPVLAITLVVEGTQPVETTLIPDEGVAPSPE